MCCTLYFFTTLLNYYILPFVDEFLFFNDSTEDLLRYQAEVTLVRAKIAAWRGVFPALFTRVFYGSKDTSKTAINTRPDCPI